jgi:polysaccharide biosynthesis transport protein
VDLRDYLRMLKRGWPAIVVIAVLFTGLAAAYLAVTPKRYEATATLLVSIRNPTTVTDLQQGNTFATQSAAAYAQIIASSTVLATVGDQMRPQHNVDDLLATVAASARTQTPLIDITAAGDDPQEITAIANATATTATKVIPALQTPGATPLVALQVIRPAVQPSTPVSPNTNRVLVLGFVLGLIVGLAGCIVVQALDTRIRRVEDLLLLTDLPALAVLPKVRRNSTVVVRDEPAGSSAEAFRALRTNVRFLDPAERGTLVIVGTADEVDGAHVPVNLAWMLAEAGEKVLLVDLELRRSAVGQILRLGNRFGMSDVLSADVAIADAVQDTDHPNLSVLPAGTARTNPSELIGSPALVDALDWMEARYPYVVVHGPPLTVSDAVVLARSTRSTLVTVTAGHTKARDLTGGLGLLANVEVRPRGLVLTHSGRTVRNAGRRRAGREPLRRFDWDRNRQAGSGADG